MPDSISLDLRVSQVQCSVGLARMLDPIHLDLAVQGIVGLTYMPHLIRLDLAVMQVQSGVGLARMLGPIRLDLEVS
jgi:hypothetical protein